MQCPVLCKTHLKNEKNKKATLTLCTQEYQVTHKVLTISTMSTVHILEQTRLL